MRVGRWGAAVTAGGALAFACGAFEADGGASPYVDAGPSSSSSGQPGTPPPDSGGTREDDDGGFDAGDNGDCFDFSDGNGHGFTLAGDVTPQAGGMRVIVHPDPAINYMEQTFYRDGGIATTRVGLDVSVNGTLPTGSQYVDALTLYYGLPAEYQKTPQTAFELVDKGALDVDIWGAAASSPYNNRRILPSELPFGTATDQFLWIDSVWDVAGGHTLSFGKAKVVVSPFQLTNSVKNDLTLRIGGASFMGAPDITLLVHRICVLVQ